MLSKSQKEEIQKHIRGEYNLCFICGESSHFVSVCPDKPLSLCEVLRKWFCCANRFKTLDYNLNYWQQDTGFLTDVWNNLVGSDKLPNRFYNLMANNSKAGTPGNMQYIINDELGGEDGREEV